MTTIGSNSLENKNFEILMDVNKIIIGTVDYILGRSGEESEVFGKIDFTNVEDIEVLCSSILVSKIRNLAKVN